VETCRLQGVEVFRYLEDVLSRISRLRMSEVAGITPRRWKKRAQVDQEIDRAIAATTHSR
jgi:hypothetical protein